MNTALAKYILIQNKKQTIIQILNVILILIYSNVSL